MLQQQNWGSQLAATWSRPDLSELVTKGQNPDHWDFCVCVCVRERERERVKSQVTWKTLVYVGG